MSPRATLTPMALAAMELLHSGPKHPYEIHQTMQEHEVWRLLKLTTGSLYHAIERLERDGLIEAVETSREGRRPERTTYRLTEHHVSGPMTRWMPWLNALQPELFVELSPELSAEREIKHGGWLTICTPRGEIEARAMVTRRLRPLRVAGRLVHQIGLPFHWGFQGKSTGSIANDLTHMVLEPNVSIEEAKAFTCNVRAGRLR